MSITVIIAICPVCTYSANATTSKLVALRSRSVERYRHTKPKTDRRVNIQAKITTKRERLPFTLLYQIWRREIYISVYVGTEETFYDFMNARFVCRPFARIENCKRNSMYGRGRVSMTKQWCACRVAARISMTL